MDTLEAARALGITLPTPAYIIGAILFGIVGLVAWTYGRRTQRPVSKWLGVALMFYPYAVSQTWLLYVVGGALCAGLFVDRG
jgi:hypothetical protein